MANLKTKTMIRSIPDQPHFLYSDGHNSETSQTFITKYFNSITSKPPIVYTPKEKHRCDTIMAQQELSTTEGEVLDQDSLEDIDWTK